MYCIKGFYLIKLGKKFKLGQFIDLGDTAPALAKVTEHSARGVTSNLSNREHAVALFTSTPISNSRLEIRYLSAAIRCCGPDAVGSSMCIGLA